MPTKKSTAPIQKEWPALKESFSKWRRRTGRGTRKRERDPGERVRESKRERGSDPGRERTGREREEERRNQGERESFRREKERE